MKRGIPLTLIFSLFLLKITAQTTHTVEVANFQFTPSNIPNVLIGDKIRWIWVSGGHTTTSTSTPPDAPGWDALINSGNTAFEYTVTTAGTYQYVCSPHAPDMAGSFTVSAPLPVTLSEFKLSVNNNKPVLSWKTLSEQNTDYFSLRKSFNGNTYSEVAKISAAGNSTTERTYSYTDNSRTSNKYVYYLLAIVDKDGKKQFSEVRTFKNNISLSKLVTSISPNPITKAGHLNMKFNADKAGTMSVKVTNIEGKSMLETTMYAVAGLNNGHVHLGGLPPGTYTLTFRLNGLKETHKVVMK